MPADKTEIQGKKGKFTWIDVTAPTQEELDSLSREFGFHHLALEDSVHDVERPKVEDYGEHSFIVAKHLNYKHKVERKQISFFIGKEFIVTVHKDEIEFLAGIKKNKLAPDAYKISDTPDYVLYLILDDIIENYFTIVDKLSEDIDHTEHTSLKEPTRKTLERVLNMRRDLIRIRRNVWPLREVLHTLQMGITAGVTKGMSFYFRDLYDHIVRIIDLTEMQREILSGILEIYLSSVSNSLNEIIKVLTVLTSFVLVPTLISSIYGMNFKYMPELYWWFGYPFALSLMFVSVVILWLFFKRKQWL
jgi:magnesium transporter